MAITEQNLTTHISLFRMCLGSEETLLLQQHRSSSKVHSRRRENNLYITCRSRKYDKEGAETDKRTKYSGIASLT